MPKVVLKNITWKQSVPWIITAVSLILIMLFIFRKVLLPGDDPLYDHLQHQNDSLKKADAGKDERLLARDKTIDSLHKQIKSNEGNIEIRYKETEKLVAVYDNFTVKQLDSLFSAKYP